MKVSSKDECTKAECLSYAAPIVVLPALLGSVEVVSWYARLREPELGSVGLLVQLDDDVRVMFVRPSLESPSHFNLFASLLIEQHIGTCLTAFDTMELTKSKCNSR